MRIQCACCCSGGLWSNYVGERERKDLRGGLEEEFAEVGEEVGSVEQLLALGDDILEMRARSGANANGATLLLEVVSLLLGESLVVLRDEFSANARRGRGDGAARRR